MIKPKTMIGRVSYPPNHQAYYVRVNIPQDGGIPLSIKATFSGFDRCDLKKGDIVEVERTDPNDARRYGVTRLFTESARPGCVDVVEPEDEPMIDGRVQFFLSHYYYCQKLVPVLENAFGMETAEISNLMVHRINGFGILCREDQFTRFLIYRNDAEIKNGFMDLKAKLVPATSKVNAYHMLAKRAGCSPKMAARVSHLLGIQTEQEVSDSLVLRKSRIVDVSGN